ncbi:hypothetical protein ACG04Q_04555 [Roseateles sp. DXS20W]|uniref:2'-5' RNA ligase family protein n=1 Tax=Pelomonas lactea TaxID=3299030 RepID=A0ABW7GFU6_9BURK
MGANLFPPSNWHQSLSARFEDEPRVVDRLRAAGDTLSARAVKLRLDRIESRPGPEGIHWAFRADHTPADFRTLVRGLGAAITAQTGMKPIKPTPHITISYWAGERLPRMLTIEPVDWLLDEVLLVRGGGRPYHYAVIARWPPQPPREQPVAEQQSLF